MPDSRHRTRLLLLLTLSTALACTSTDSARRELLPPPEAPSEASAAIEPPGERFTLPGGHYWVRRATGLVSASRSGGGFNEPPETTTKGGTRCELLEVGPDWGARKLSLVMNGWRWPEGRMQGRAAFRVKETERGWDLRGPELTRGWVSLSGSCRQELVVEAPAEGAGFLASNAGPLFREPEACEAAPAHFVQRCRGDDCRYDDPASRPFALPECELTLSILRARASMLVEVPNAAAMRTLVRLDEVARTGGELWERKNGRKPFSARDRAGTPCDRVSVSPLEKGRAALTRRYPTGDGGQSEDVAVYEFSPLSHSAVIHRHDFSTHYPGEQRGGMGMSGGLRTRVELYLADGAMLLGRRWLYFDRSVCEPKAAP